VREGVIPVDYSNIDWDQDPPDRAGFIAAWDRAVVTPIQPLDPRLAAVAQALGESHVNGGGRVAQFRVEAEGALAWFLARNRLNEHGFFDRFFRHPHVVAALPEAAGRTAERGSPDFTLENSFVNFGRVAVCISEGGAYRRFAGSDEEALRLAEAFMRAAFGMRFSEASAWVCWKPWSDWFRDVAWDASFFWFDPRTGVATILLITDTD